MATNTKSTADRVFDALTESSAAVVERVKSGNERANRVVSAVIKEAEWVQTEALGLGRQIAQNPTDILGITGTAYQKSIEVQERVFDFARSWIDEMATAVRETRGTFERIGRANIAAGQPAVESVKSIVSRTSEVLRPGAIAQPVKTTRRTQSEEAA